MIDVSNLSPFEIEKLYGDLYEEKVIVEEVVRQHPELAKFNASTTNTVRVYSLLTVKNDVLIMIACGRFGRAGRDADNFHQGGCGVMIDIESGTVYTDGLDINHRSCYLHPDSSIPFRGVYISNVGKC